jgi:hypothetical protein
MVFEITCVSAVPMSVPSTCRAKKNATINESRVILGNARKYIDFPPAESPLLLAPARIGPDSPTVLLRENFLKESLKSTCNSPPFYHRQENGQEENESNS